MRLMVLLLLAVSLGCDGSDSGESDEAAARNPTVGNGNENEEAPECGTPADCVSPGSCELTDGAACEAGFCVYAPVICDSPPAPECTGDDSTYRTFASPGTCTAGECEYVAMEQRCENCANECLGSCDGVVCDDLEFGCRTSGACMPGEPGVPASCVYTDAEDAIPCDDGDPCTTGDSCTSGVCDATPVLDGMSCDGTPGTCNGGDCVECIDNDDCDDSNACTDDSCGGDSRCVYAARDGEGCDDGSLCTQTDTCNAAGECIGTEPVTCTPGECEATSTCNPGTGLCETTPVAPDTQCDDSDLCTFDDRCDDSGGCAGTAIVCDNDPPPCGAERSCNGTSVCTTTFPLVSCSDFDLCTSGDLCDGGGVCRGTPIANGEPCQNASGVCNAGVCRECFDSSDCAGSGPRDICDNGICVECLNAGQCLGGECTIGTCSSGRCTFIENIPGFACGPGLRCECGSSGTCDLNTCCGGPGEPPCL
ncbi:MAG: hypothetical protein AAF654_07100 [Myxococcota bacterium]